MQQSVQHQMMGYDRASIVFSPDGRLLQVEYAKKAVEQGTTAIGMTCKDGAVLIADKRIVDKFIVPSSVEKVFQVDDHIAVTATGYLMDGRVVAEKAQIIAQQHKVTYDTNIDTLSLVKEISNMKQAFTQYGGARPFGVSLLFIGVDDDGPRLFGTEPTGIYFEYVATAVGEGESEAEEMLKKEYKEGMSMDDSIKLGIKILKKVLGRDFDVERVEVAFVRKEDRQYGKLKKEDIENVVNKLK